MPLVILSNTICLPISSNTLSIEGVLSVPVVKILSGTAISLNFKADFSAIDFKIE